MKLQPELVPVLPQLLLQDVFTRGAIKHTPRGWEDGMPWSEVAGRLERHWLRWRAGQTFDVDDGQHNLASVLWAASVLIQYEQTHPELNDLPHTAADDSALRVFESYRTHPQTESAGPALVLQSPGLSGVLSSTNGTLPESPGTLAVAETFEQYYNATLAKALEEQVLLLNTFSAKP